MSAGSVSETKELKPFHESVIEAIATAGDDDINPLLELIETTKIPKNHINIAMAIIEALEGGLQNALDDYLRDNMLSALKSVLKRKAAEEERFQVELPEQ